jgi:pyrimidine deaminase RibD-like protein
MPSPDSRNARNSSDFDRHCMQLAIDEARKSTAEDAGVHPLIGAVAAQGGTVLGTAFRGELMPGGHAEYILLEHKLSHAALSGATIYTIVEPCVTRQHPKISCVQRLIERRVGKVFIGMLEPNAYVTGRSLLLLRESGIATEFFPADLAAQVEELNRPFIQASKNSLPPPKVKISGYEWDLLEDRGDVAGRDQQMWYEYLLAANDIHNLERLLSFYTPPAGEVSERTTFDITPSETPRIAVATDLRLIGLITADPARVLSLTPRQFEIFTGELLEHCGYSGVTLGQGSKDGGVDVSAYIVHPFGTERVIVQCKRHAPDHKVGEPIIKQLLADADIHKAARGLIVTTSYLTSGARLLIDSYRHRLSALDYDLLLRLLRGEDPQAKP